VVVQQLPHAAPERARHRVVDPLHVDEEAETAQVRRVVGVEGEQERRGERGVAGRKRGDGGRQRVRRRRGRVVGERGAGQHREAPALHRPGEHEAGRADAHGNVEREREVLAALVDPDERRVGG
jgi:hypothetical protein